MHSLGLKQRLGAVTENILTPSCHGRSLKILFGGGGGVFKSKTLLMVGTRLACVKTPLPSGKFVEGSPFSNFSWGGGGGSVHRLGLDSLLNEEVTDI